MMEEEDHVVALRKAFPGVWVRADGSFRDDELGIFWSPGDAEKVDERLMHGALHSSAYDGLCCFPGPPQGRGPALRLSQLSTLVDYIAEVNRRSTKHATRSSTDIAAEKPE